MKIARDVKHIAKAKLRSFIDLSNATGQQQGIIKVNHNTSKVTVGKDGEDVQFQGGIFNSWRQRSLDRMLQAMQEQFDKFKADYQAAAARPDLYEAFEGQSVLPAVKGANHEGVSLGNNKNAVLTTWWKDPGVNHCGATITHSKMRHVMEMQALPKGGKLNLLKGSGMKV